MSEEMDYCQYFLNKCTDESIPRSIRHIYQTIDSIRDAYKSSKGYLKSRDSRNTRLMKALSFFIEEDSDRFGRLDPDANRVLQRSIDRITNVRTYDDIFAALSDYLWIKASVRLCETGQPGTVIHLTAIDARETRHSALWLVELKKEIDDAKYDLKCMKEADKLPIKKQILQILIENDDVAWYANPHNISYSQLKQRMSERREFIENQERVYFSFLATNIYREHLRWRYR